MEYNTRKTLEIYLAHAGKYKLWGSIILLSVIFGAATNVITPLFYKKFFDTLVSGQIKEEIVSGLISVLALVLVIKIAGWISWRAADFMSVKFQRSVIADLSNTCFKYLHKHSFSYFNNNFTGSLVKRVSYFPRAFEEISDRIAWNFLPLVVSIVIIIAVLFSKNILLGAVILLWLFIVVALNWFLAKYKLKYDIKVSEDYTEATGFLSDTITNNSNVKLFCGFKREVAGFAGLNERIRKLSQFSWNLNGVFEAVQVFFIVMLEIGMFYIGIGLWEKGNFTIGDFVLLQAYIIIIFQNTINLGKMIRMTYHDLA
ncbi:MAG: ABC transporter ATP-binding protein, partial [Patescibacteria group bacterium]